MRDYARKPFIDTNYRDLIKGIPEKAVYNIQTPYGIFEKQAEFKRPYLETEYRKMKERHTAKIPYIAESDEYDTGEVIPGGAVTENIPEDELPTVEEVAIDPLTWGDNTDNDYPNKMIDCLIYEAGPDTNYDGVYIAVGKGSAANRTNRTLIKFNVKADLESIHAPKIYSAILHLYVETMAGTHTVSAYRVFQNWIENQITWNSFSTGNPWNTAGCAAASDAGTDDGSHDRKATAEASDGTISTLDYTIFLDLTDLVKKWYDGTAKEYGVLLQTDNEAISNYVRMSQREEADGIRGYLRINFQAVEEEKKREWLGVPRLWATTKSNYRPARPTPSYGGVGKKDYLPVP